MRADNYTFQGRCPCCGGDSFFERPILWPRLIEEWGLSPEEVTYIDRQQGFECRRCKNKLRGMALAAAFCAEKNTSKSLADYSKGWLTRHQKILEVNHADALTPYLEEFTGHTQVLYPQVRLEELPFDAESFDFVIHSDTLEHVESPVEALTECLRVLKPGGACLFTVPVIVGRLSRSREGLPPSYHGDVTTTREDYIVTSEFGADTWTYLAQAGFAHVEVFCFDYPAGLVHIGRK